jgi:hypothetical protein
MRTACPTNLALHLIALLTVAMTVHVELLLTASAQFSTDFLSGPIYARCASYEFSVVLRARPIKGREFLEQPIEYRLFKKGSDNAAADIRLAQGGVPPSCSRPGAPQPCGVLARLVHRSIGLEPTHTMLGLTWPQVCRGLVETAAVTSKTEHFGIYRPILFFFVVALALH